MQGMHANKVISINELAINPEAALAAVEDEPVAILNRNKLAGYLISAEVWEAISDRFDNLELVILANTRLANSPKPVKMSLDEL